MTDATTGPSRRTIRSTQCSPRLMFLRRLYVESVTFCDPMKATAPSTTSSLRWLRRSGRWYLPLNGCTGQHQVPLRAHGVEPLERLPVEGLAAVGPVVQQHPHGDAPRRRPPPGRGRNCRSRHPTGGCRTRRGRTASAVRMAVRHRVEALLVLGDEVRGVVAGQRHRAEVAVQGHQRGEPLGRVRAQRPEVEVLARVVDVAR